MTFPQKSSWVICLLNECEAKGDREGKKIRALVEQILDETAKRHMQVELVLVNNASTDNTEEVLNEMKSRLGNITVLDEPVQGKARAERAAFKYLSKERRDTVAVVTMDADGEHDIRDMIKLCQEFQVRKPLFACGNRFAGGKRNKKDEILRDVLVHFSEVAEGQVPDDPRCGARVYDPEFLFRTYPKTVAENYGLELELVGLALREIKTNPQAAIHSEGLDYYIPLRSKVFKKKDRQETNPELWDICRVLSNVFGERGGDAEEGEQIIREFGKRIGRERLFSELSELFYKGKMVTDEGQKEPQEFMEVPPTAKK